MISTFIRGEPTKEMRRGAMGNYLCQSCRKPASHSVKLDLYCEDAHKEVSHAAFLCRSCSSRQQDDALLVHLKRMKVS